jgi:hypothetical protein
MQQALHSQTMPMSCHKVSMGSAASQHTQCHGQHCSRVSATCDGAHLCWHAATGYATATNSRGTWAPAVTGNIVIVGTDPGNHGVNAGASTAVKNGATALINAAVSYVAGEHCAGRLFQAASDQQGPAPSPFPSPLNILIVWSRCGAASTNGGTG